MFPRLCPAAEIDLLNHEYGWLWFAATALLLFLAGLSLFRVRRSRKQLLAANAELDRSRKQLQATIDAIPDVLFKLDRDGRYLECHCADESLLFLSRSELLGKKVSEVLPANAAAVYMQAIQDALAHGKSTGAQYALDFPGGKRWFGLSVARKTIETSPVFIAIARDITEYKEHQDALLQRAQLREQIAALAEAVPGFLFTIRVDVDGHTHFPFASSGVEELFGLRPEDIRADAEVLRARYHPEDLIRMRQLMWETARSLAPFRIEIRIRHPKGDEWRWIEVRSTPKRQADGATEWYGMMIDITESKRVELALKEGEGRYRQSSSLLQSIFNSPNSVAVYALDRDYRYLAFNGRHRENVKRKWRTDIALGMRMIDVVDTEAHREFCRQGFDQVLAGRSFSLESREPVVEAGATVYEYNENHAAPIRDDRGQIIGLTVFAINITERKRMETALKESEARYRHDSNLLQSIFESPNSVSVYALDREYRFLAFNHKFREAAERLWGTKVAVGMSMLDAIDTEAHREFARQGCDQVLAGRSFLLESNEKIIRNGETKYEYHENYGSPIYNDNHEIIGLTVFAIDITERKLMEQQLAVREREFRTLVDNLPDTIYRYDRDCRRIYVSPSIERLTGTTVQQLIGNTPADGQLVVPEQSRKLMQAIRDVFETGENQYADIEYTNVNGTRDFAFVLAPEFDAGGKIETVLSIGRDVTAIRSIERRMERFMANAAAFVFTFRRSSDGQCAFPFASPGIERLFGVAPEEVRDDVRLLQSQIHPDDTVRIERAVAESAQTMEPFYQEFRVSRPGQPDNWIESRAIPERDSNGDTLWQGIMLDISERKQAESALVCRERDFRTLAENSPDFIARYDDRGCIRYVNPRLARFAGVTLEEAVDKSVTGLLPPGRETPVYLDAFVSTLRSGIGREIEVVSGIPGKEGHFLIRFAAEHDEHGSISGVLALGHDITEIKRKGRELEESRDMLRKLTAHRDSAREEERKNIAREIHDHLGQLLTAQRLDIATLKYRFAGEHPILAERCQHLLDVTDLTIQAVRDMATMLRPSSLDMGLVPALEWLSSDFRKRNAIACSLFIDGTQEFDLDEGQSLAIFRIAQESLTNVARHAEATWVRISLAKHALGLRLTIRDNGKGFDPAKVSFTSFGLLGIRERAMMIGGSADISSAPHEGTTIEIDIPLVREPVDEA